MLKVIVTLTFDLMTSTPRHDQPPWWTDRRNDPQTYARQNTTNFQWRRYQCIKFKINILLSLEMSV